MSDLSLSFLGSFAASFDGQSLLPFRAKSVQALLIYLVCETERAHQRETLMDLFWPGMPLDSAQANLRQTLYRLRQAIPEARSSEAGTTVPFVLADRRTIQINPEAVYQADVQQLAELIDHDPEQAINLYRGDFLADFYLPDSETFEEWVNGRRAHTQRLILTALDEVTAVHLQNGRYDEAENLARRQLTIDNLLESGHRQLMESLARNGRRRAALSHYESLSQLLQAELDITPSSATQALVQAIRAGELAERGERREENVESVKVEIEQPPLSTPHLPLPASTPRHNLPAQATPFIGRETELEELGKLIANPPTSLTTIVGPGGMGKTRLALATAERILKGIQFPDGVFFVDLAPLNEAPQIPEAVAKALEIQFGGEEQLLEFLRDKAMFFILDNFEHVLAGAQWVNTILTTAPGVQVLVTSRERLGLRGEQLFQIPGLDFPDWITPENASDYNAARLFLGAAQRLRSDFVLTEVDLPSLTHICQLVGGMPLALELAAGWVELLSLAEIAAEIEQGLDFLETELQDVPERQRSMQTVFSTTWERLELAEQEMLRKLSVFRGGFTREAAAQVAYGGGSAAATLKLLGRLVNKSLLQTNPSQGRYQLHELLRQYAAEQLEKAGETESTRTTHADFFVEMAHQLEGEIKGGRQQKEALDAIEADLANIQAAWDWALIQGDLAAIVRSLEALSWFNQFRQAVDVRQMYQRVQTLLPQGSERYANPLWRRITLFFPPDLGREENLKHLEQILAAARHDGNHKEIFWVLRILTFLKYRGGNVSDALETLQESQSVLRRIGDTFFEYWYLGHISFYYFEMGQPEKRLELIRQQFELAQKKGDRLTVADAQGVLGFLAEKDGRYGEAEAIYQQVLPVFREFRDRWHMFQYVTYLGRVAFLQGDFSRARAWIAEGQTLSRQFNLLDNGEVLSVLSMLLNVQEQYIQAVEVRQDISPVYDFFYVFNFHRPKCMAYAQCGLGNFTLAKNNLHKAFEMAVYLKAPGWQVQLLPAAALIAASEDRLERAAELLTLAWHHPAGITGWLEKFPLIIHLQEQLELELSPLALTEARQRGQRLSLKETIESLLKELSELGRGEEAEERGSGGAGMQGRFVKEELLATGGFGEVHRGRDRETGQIVVIKRLKPELVAQQPDVVARFVREGELLRQLNHPNIVQMIAVEEIATSEELDGEQCLIMEYVAGGSLRDLLDKEGRLSVARTVDIALELADALSRAHHLDIIHRDLKPGNVLLAEDGTPRLTDFGIARMMERQRTQLTEAGSILGTIEYMSPEACRGEDLDVQADVWSFGVLLYEMLTGQLPFQGKQIAATILAILNKPTPDLLAVRSDVPTALVRLIEGMLVKGKGERIGRMRQVAAELDRIRGTI